MGAYIYLRDAEYIGNADGTMLAKGGMVCVNYCDADSIIPLTVENGLITECAFCGTNKVRGKDNACGLYKRAWTVYSRYHCI